MTTDALAGAVGLYRRTARSRSALVLLVANAIPLVGVAFFGWSLFTILVLYWIENGIVGFWNVPRIVMARGSILPTLPDLPEAAARAATASPAEAALLHEPWRRAQAAQHAPTTPPGTAGMAAMGTAMNRLAGVGRLGLAFFFTIHYGIFWFVHGVFVFVLPAFGTDLDVGDGASAFGELEWSYVALAAVALFISHGASFVLNYVGRGEYLSASPSGQMAAAYGRVVVLHLTIIFGALVVAFLGAPIGALLILVGLKTSFDLGLHLREHRAAGLPPSKGADPA